MSQFLDETGLTYFWGKLKDNFRKAVELTQAEYDALTEKEADVIYYITDAGPESPENKDTKARNMIAKDWIQKTYSANDICISEGYLWICLQENSIKPVEGTYWHKTTLGDQISALLSIPNAEGRSY